MLKWGRFLGQLEAILAITANLTSIKAPESSEVPNKLVANRSAECPNSWNKDSESINGRFFWVRLLVDGK